MPITILPPLNVSRASAQLQRRLGAVEVVCLLREVLDLLGDDAAPGRQHEVLVSELVPVAHAVGGDDALQLLIDGVDLADDELDTTVQERALRPVEPVFALAAHGDVHEARLVDVVAVLVDDGDARRALVDLAVELPAQEIGDEGSADAAADDEDALNRHAYRSFSTMISSYPSRASRDTRRWPAFWTHIGISVLDPLSLDQTEMMSPTWPSRMARMSSMSGPGQ